MEFRPRKAPVEGLHGQALTAIGLALLGLVAWSALQSPDMEPLVKANAWRGLLLFWPSAGLAAMNAIALACGRRLPGWWQLAPWLVLVASIVVLKLT